MAYVPQLTKNESFSPFFEGPGQTQSVTFVIHMTAQEAVNHEDYKAWMHKFGAKTEVWARGKQEISKLSRSTSSLTKTYARTILFSALPQKTNTISTL